MKKIAIIIMTMLMISITACGNNEKKIDSSKPIVYASFFPIYDLTKTIGGDKINIISFMPEDKEAHYWEPSAKDIKEINHADLMFINGADMEPWVDKVKNSAPNLDIVDLSKDLNLITAGSVAEKGEYGYIGELELNSEQYKIDIGHTHEKELKMGFLKFDESKDNNKMKEECKKIMSKEPKDIKQKENFDIENGQLYKIEMAHEHGEVSFKVPEKGKWLIVADRPSDKALSYLFLDSSGNEVNNKMVEKPKNQKTSYDPHSWLSLENPKLYAERIANHLSKLSPENKDYFMENKKKFQEEIDKLKEEYKEKFKSTKIKSFVVPHEAFGYIGREFGLEQHPLQGLTSMEDPDLKTIQESIDFCKNQNINTVFYEYGGSKKGAEAIAKEINGTIKPLSTMEFVSEEQKEKKQGYLELMKMNLENIYESLK